MILDCPHKKEGCVKCGEYTADRGVTCCEECSDDCQGRCEWALIQKTKSMLADGSPALDKLPNTIDLVAPVSTFDHTQIDNETASFLRQKETIVGGYMHRTRYDVGQELKEALNDECEKYIDGDRAQGKLFAGLEVEGHEVQVTIQ